ATTTMKIPIPESSASTLTAAPRCSAGASSTIKAVTTPATSTSKQTAKSLKNARIAIEGAKPLARLASEEPATPTAINRLRPNLSVSVDSGSASIVATASTDTTTDGADLLAWNPVSTARS